MGCQSKVRERGGAKNDLTVICAIRKLDGWALR
jgi:hypothetical protein